MTRRLCLALVLLCTCLAMSGVAEASSLPAGRLFGLGCVKGPADPHSCGLTVSPGIDGGEAVAAGGDGRFVWAGGADGVLWTFRRGAFGRLAAVGCQDDGSACPVANAIERLFSVDALAPSPDGHDLYAVDVINAGDGRLHVLHVRADGTLSDGGCFEVDADCGAGNAIPGLANAADVAVSRDGRNVYVAAGSGTDKVSEFARAADGSLTYLGCVGDAGCAQVAPGLAGASGLAESPSGNYLYVASTGANFGGTADGTVASLKRQADGTLAANGCVEQTGAPSACTSNGPGLVDPVGVAASDNAVYVASRDGFDGSRSSVVTLPRGAAGTILYGSCFGFSGFAGCGAGRAIPGISNAFAIVMGPDRKTVHVSALGGIGANEGAATSFTRAAGGALSPGGCLAELGSPEACLKTAAIESGGEDIAVTQDGTNVYMGTGGGLAILGREVPPTCRNADALVPGRATDVPLPCSDRNWDALTRAPIAGPAHGDIQSLDDAAGTARYKPTPGYVGADFITFSARGGSLSSNSARLNIAVTNVRPKVTRLKLSRKRFRRGRKLPRASRKAKVGTRITFRLSEPARVTLSFERVVRGRFRRIRTRLRLRGDTGRNSVRFQGRLTRRKRLKAGRYRLTVVARDKQGVRSKRRRARFRLVR